MRLRCDSARCNGCKACELACSAAHAGEFSPARSRIRIHFDALIGKAGIDFCHSCGKAPCVRACTYGACTRDEELGTIKIDYASCVACYACVEACPFGADFVDPVEHVPLICDGCGGDPTCAKFCPTRAITVAR